MNSPLATTIEWLEIADQIIKSNGRAVPIDIVASGKSATRTSTDNLIVLVEAPHTLPSTLRDTIIKTISDSYRQNPSTSLTSRLLRAIRRANTVALGMKLDKDTVNRLGVACLAIKDNNIILAQAGPSLAFIAHQVEAHPVGYFELFQAQPNTPLGSTEAVEISVFRSAVSVRDIIVMASDTLDQEIDVRKLGPTLRGLKASQVRSRLANVWKLAAAPSDLSALIVEIGEATDEYILPTDYGYDEKPYKVSADTHAEPSFNSPSMPSPSITLMERTQRQRTSRAQRDAAPPASSLTSARTLADDTRPTTDSQLAGDRLVHFFERQASSVPKALGKPGLNRLGGFGAMRKYALYLAVLIVIALAIFGLARVWQTWQTQETIIGIMADAEDKERLALSSTEPVVKRQLLLEADALMQEAENMGSTDPNLRIIKERLRQELDSMGEVNRVPLPGLLLDLNEVGGSGKASDCLLAGEDLYILDSAGNALYKWRIKGAGTTAEVMGENIVLRRGGTVADSTVGRPLALTLLPAGGARSTDSMACLDDQGHLFTADQDGQWSVLRLRADYASTRNPLIGGYAGNLYILDPKANKLQWYPATATGFDQLVYNYLNSPSDVDFANAVAMAVDSNLYVLHKDSRIDKFFGGEPQPFDAIVPDVPLAHTTAIAVGPHSKSLYVLDSGNDRILEYGADGGFIRQIKSTESDGIFRNGRDLAIDEANNRVYVLTGDKVYSLSLN